MFQKPATLIMFHIIDLHHLIMFWLIVIFVHVTWMLFVSLWIFRENYNMKPYKRELDINWNVLFYRQILFSAYILKRNKVIRKNARYINNAFVEFFLIIFPSLILSILLSPSLDLLYFMDHVNYNENGTIVIKVIGNQWYWRYEGVHYDNITKKYMEYSFDSYMALEKFQDSTRKYIRLLSVDKPLVLPINVNIQILVTSTDVIHSWAVPAFGIKVDAIPGRINQASFIILRKGIYYGQCSELCGVNHSFMPIEIVAIE
jgi:cytochrome c oxidase subunit II